MLGLSFVPALPRLSSPRRPAWPQHVCPVRPGLRAKLVRMESEELRKKLSASQKAVIACYGVAVIGGLILLVSGLLSSNWWTAVLGTVMAIGFGFSLLNWLKFIRKINSGG